jgi:ankyrin repeat protein
MIIQSKTYTSQNKSVRMIIIIVISIFTVFTEDQMRIRGEVKSSARYHMTYDQESNEKENIQDKVKSPGEMPTGRASSTGSVSEGSIRLVIPVDLLVDKNPQEPSELVPQILADPTAVEQYQKPLVDIPDLVLAAMDGDQEKVSRLVAGGANPNVQAPDGRTALIESICYNNPAIAQFLLAADCNIHIKTKNGLTALTAASASGFLEIVEAILKRGADANDQTSDGMTPLMQAAAGRYPTVVAILLDHGANPNLTDIQGSTALHHAAAGGEDESGGDFRCVQLLLESGANPNVTDTDGQTPLTTAAFYNDVKSIRALIKAGAEVNLRNEAGETALGKAKSAGSTAAGEILELAGAHE